MNLTESTTPRTDREEQRVEGPNAWSPHPYGAVRADFARSLERELDAMEQKYAKEYTDRRTEAATLRNEAREWRDKFYAKVTTSNEEFNALRDALLKIRSDHNDYVLRDYIDGVLKP